jgi:diadenosine tetraphosphate (Ap4A) HIT family hydrolase
VFYRRSVTDDRVQCRNCAEIEAIESGEHGYGIARLANGYLWLNPTQYHRGAVFYVARQCVAELFELEAPARRDHLMEMAAVASAVQRCVGAPKMNYEALGNSVPHLHWWLTPRHADDARPHGPIWEDMEFLKVLWTRSAVVEPAASAEIRLQILRELLSEDVSIEATYV